MYKKSTLMIIVASLFLIMFSQMSFAYTLTTVGGYGPYQSEQGGEFTLSPGDGLSWVLNYYDAKATGGSNYPGTFESFCLEHGEYIYPDTTHSATLNSGAVLGGAGGSVGGIDPLSKGSAWLYYQFAKGTLANYNYDGTNAERKSSAAALQDAIWWLEEESADPGAGNVFREAILAAFGNAANAMADNGGLYPVMVANLWENGYAGVSGHERQDVLIVTPIPSAIWLLGWGLIGLVGVRRRRMQA